MNRVKKHNPLSLRRQVAWHVILPVVFLLACVLGLNLYIENQQHREDANAQMQSEASQVATQLGKMFESVVTTVAATVTMLNNSADYSDDHLIALTRLQLQINLNLHGSGIAINPETQGRAFNPYTWRSANGTRTMDFATNASNYVNSNFDWWNKAVNSNVPIWSKAHFDYNVGNFLLVKHSASFYSRGELQGVVVADMSLHDLAQRLGVDERELLLVDSQGNLLAHHNPQLLLNLNLTQVFDRPNLDGALNHILTRRKGVERITLKNGEQSVVAFHRVPASDWVVLLNRPAELIDGPLRADLQRNLMQLALFSLLLFATIWILVRRMVKPMEKLRRRLIDIQQGGHELAPLRHPGTEEIGALDQGLLDMADAIKEREVRLKEAHENRVARLMRGMGDRAFYYTMSRENKILKVSDSVEKVLGYSPPSFISKHQRLFTDSTVNDNSWDLQNQLLTGVAIPPHQVEMRHANGTVRRFNAFMQPIFDEVDHICGIEALLTDITEELEAGRHYQAVIEAAPDAILLTERDGSIVYINQQAEMLTGYQRDELIGKPVEVLVPISSRNNHATLRHGYMRNPSPRPMGVGLDLCLLRADGEELPVEISLSQLPATGDGPPKMSAIMRDISERRVMERNLKVSEERFRTLVSNIPSVVYRCKLNRSMVFMSEDVLEMTGFPAYSFIENQGQSFTELIHEDDRDWVREEISNAVNGRRSFTLEYRIVSRSNKLRWIYEKGQAHYDEHQVPQWIDGAMHDITDKKTSQQKIARAKEQMETITASVPGVVFQLTEKTDKSEARCTFISGGINKVLGLTQQQVMDDLSSLLDLIEETDRIKLKHAVRQSALKMADWELELRATPVSGAQRWFSIGARVEKTEDDKVWWNGFLLDITERKQMQHQIAASEAHFRALFDNAGIAIVTLDRFGIIAEANEKFYQFTEQTNKELVGQNITQLVPAEERDELSTALKPLLAGQQVTLSRELPYKKPDGSLRWADTRAVLLSDKDGQVDNLVLTLSDVTERREVNQALRRAKDAADAASKAKSDFLANMSHEIRTPMNAIIGMTQLCLQHELTPRLADYLSKIDSASQSLLGLLNDVLDYSKIEAGKLDIEETDFALEELLERLSDLFAIKASDKGVELLFAVEPGVPSQLHGDPLRLGQVLINLLSNSIKFTEQGEVVLSIRAEEVGDQVMMTFSVRDTGIGMGEEQCQRLFQSFSQADTSTTRKFGGTGLGLAISQSLVRLMGGNIEVDSALGAGSDFHFRLPMVLPKQPPKPELLALEGKQILIVDDNDTALDVLEANLASFGFDVVTAHNGEQALQKVDELNQLVLIITDYKMPVMNGLTLTKALKERGIDAATIMMISAFTDEMLARQAEQAGIGALLSKPASPSKLLDTILSQLGDDAIPHIARRKPDWRLNKNQINYIRDKRVLLVEDNAINQQVACEFLEQLSLKVNVAEHGKIALDKLRKNQFDLVLMDCQMPVMDGYEASQAIREELKSEIPIIAMTANAMQEDRENCLAAGMNEHIAKPIDLTNLHRVLWRYLGDGSEPEDIREPEDPKLTRWPQHPDLDVDKGLQLVQGSTKLYERLLTRFVDHHSDGIEIIQTHCEAEEWDEALRMAHSLKGLAGNLSSPVLIGLFAAMEQELKNERPVPKETLARATKILSDIVAAIEVWRPDADSVANKVEKTSPDMNTVVKQLKPLVDSYDARAADVIDELLSKDDVEHEQLRQLATLIKNYQFTQASEWLGTWREKGRVN